MSGLFSQRTGEGTQRAGSTKQSTGNIYGRYVRQVSIGSQQEISLHARKSIGARNFMPPWFSARARKPRPQGSIAAKDRVKSSGEPCSDAGSGCREVRFDAARDTGATVITSNWFAIAAFLRDSGMRFDNRHCRSGGEDTGFLRSLRQFRRQRRPAPRDIGHGDVVGRPVDPEVPVSQEPVEIVCPFRPGGETDPAGQFFAYAR